MVDKKTSKIENTNQVDVDKSAGDDAIFGIISRVFLWTSDNPKRWPRYLWLAAVFLGLIWGCFIAYIKLATPKYKSEWTLILPGKGMGANVSLVDIGQTSTSASSPYASSSTNPKANYKEFAVSLAVLKKAANSLDMSVRKFGKPRVKLVDQTSLLFLSMEGATPKIAQEKAYALHRSLLELLDKLRQDEIGQHEGGALKALEGYRKKLDAASRKLLDFQSNSNLVSMAQFNEIVMSIEQLRREKTQAIASMKEVEAKAKRLQRTLGLSPKQASDALILQNDQVFQEHISAYTKARQELITHKAKWGMNHPEVKRSYSEYTAADKSLKGRFTSLVSTKFREKELLLSLKSDSTRNKLMQDLIDFDVVRQGLVKKITSLQKIIEELIEERNKLTIPASRLDELIRNHQVAEAIFTSALARTDTSKSDVFVSYPLVQLLDSPSLPERPSSPNKVFAFLGALASSLFVIIGLSLLWIRKPYIQKILKKK